MREKALAAREKSPIFFVPDLLFPLKMAVKSKTEKADLVINAYDNCLLHFVGHNTPNHPNAADAFDSATHHFFSRKSVRVFEHRVFP